MIAVIRYHTPYLFHGKDPLTVSFALGDDISIRIVLGLPTLLAMGATIDLQRGTLVCSEL